MSDPAPSLLDAFSVILVRTRKGGNIGSVARAMRNMGLSRLKLVAPEEVLTDECRWMAGRAVTLVEQARIYDDWEAAIADEQVLVGTTSHRARRQPRPLEAPRALAPRLAAMAGQNRIALVFGSERQGLSDDLLARCDVLASIPVNPDHPTLNLAQAVLVMAYEVFLAAGGGAPEVLPERATHAEREGLYAHLERVLHTIGFFGTQNPVHLMKDFRRIFATAALTPRDVRILRGVLSRMDWYVQRCEGASRAGSEK